MSAVRPVETRLALAPSQDALPLPAAALGTVACQFLGDLGHEPDRLGIAVIVVDRQEPVARLQVVAGVLPDTWLQNISSFRIGSLLLT